MTALRDRLRALKVLQGPFLPFDIESAPDDPTLLFLHWLETAIAHEVPEPHAMTLSTADQDGFPDARVLILKNVDSLGFHFAISAASRKGRQLSARPQAALTFYWQKLARQIRVRGVVVDLGPEASAADFAAARAQRR
jgi:pyridoxamine 5'-phosphate oxidase